MNKKQKKQIEEKLNNEVEDTKTKINKYKELSQPIAPENSIGRISRMDAINNKSVVEAALREAEEKLLKLLDIQKKITQKDFG
jgi:DnaK suppressor protein